jgi:hypothetical protein
MLRFFVGLRLVERINLKNQDVKSRRLWRDPWA